MQTLRFSFSLLILFTAFGLGHPHLSAQYRSISGIENNLIHPTWGAQHSMLINSCRIGFADGLSMPATRGSANPRVISNTFFDQAGDLPNSLDLNDLFWAFGQFIDHDLVHTSDNPSESFDIAVPTGDVMFDPTASGTVSIPLHRSASVVDSSGVRRYLNEVTAFIDGSMIYGSTADRAAYLRAFEGGKLRVTSAGLPVFNTLTGEYGSPVDPDAPSMAGAEAGRRVLVCGDVRANENSLLAALHTLWVREHNRICDSLSQLNPALSDEELYLHSRMLVGAMLQRITYREWLPLIGVDLPASIAYDQAVNPSISNEFASAGFRFGHSLVGSEIWLFDQSGNHTADSPLSLRDVFFDPLAVLRTNGLDNLLRGAFAHEQQEFDAKVVDDLRNFLFGMPGSGGMDLAAINIARGRERGLTTFNAMREDLGLTRYLSFASFTDAQTQLELEAQYGSIDSMDAWVGLLLERQGVPGATLVALLSEQFERLAAGDRFFYSHHPAITPSELAWIENQSLLEVINRNTDASLTGESFRAGSISSTQAFAKTSGQLRGHLSGNTLHIFGLEPQEKHVVKLSSMLGQELATFDRLSASGFGESQFELTSLRDQQLVVVTVYRSGKGVESMVLIGDQ